VSNPDHVRLLNAGRSHIEEFRRANPTVRLDLSRENLSGRDYSQLNLDGAIFREAILSNTQFRATSLLGADFTSASMDAAQLTGANAKGASFRNAILNGGGLANFNAEEGDFADSHIREAQLQGANLKKATLVRADLSQSHLPGAFLNGADLSQAILVGTHLERCDLSDADLRQADLHLANLSGAKVTDTKIRRLDVEDLRLENLAGLHPSQLHGMAIEDGFGELRRYFSGFWTLVHLISVGVWLTPILWIIARSVALSIAPTRVSDKLHALTLLEQIWGYWKSGNVNPALQNGQPTYPFSFFFFASWSLVLLYNLARLALVFRVKLWEHQQSVTGLHPDVTVEGWLKTTFNTVAVLFYFNLLLVLWHFVIFLQTPFPVLTTTN
jgi:uncharacterized protein YjbI with pentapeptide repeats